MKYFWTKITKGKLEEFEKTSAFDKKTAIFNVSLKNNCDKRQVQVLEVPIHLWNLDPKTQWRKFEM
jgi:hypothetical protein